MGWGDQWGFVIKLISRKGLQCPDSLKFKNLFCSVWPYVLFMTFHVLWTEVKPIVITTVLVWPFGPVPFFQKHLRHLHSSRLLPFSMVRSSRDFQQDICDIRRDNRRVNKTTFSVCGTFFELTRPNPLHGGVLVQNRHRPYPNSLVDLLLQVSFLGERLRILSDF